MFNDLALVFRKPVRKVKNACTSAENDQDPVTNHDKVFDWLVWLEFNLALDFSVCIVPDIKLGSWIKMVITCTDDKEYVRLLVWLDKGCASRNFGVDLQTTTCSFMNPKPVRCTKYKVLAIVNELNIIDFALLSFVHPNY